MAQANVGRLKVGWKDLPEIDPAPPRRTPEYWYNTAKRSIELTTNHFPVEFKNPNIVMVHYDVVIKNHRGDDRIPKTIKLDVFERMKKTHRETFEKHLVAYDREKSAYSVWPIPGITEEEAVFKVRLDVGSNSSSFTVAMKEVARARLKDLMDTLRCRPGAQQKMPSHIYMMLEIMFRHYLGVRYIQIGARCFFPHERDEFGRHADLTMGKQGLVGFFSSLRPAAWKDGSVLLNIDVSHTAFYKEQDVLDFVKEILQVRDEELRHPLQDYHMKRLNKEIKGIKVRVTHTNIPRKYKVNKVMPFGAARQKFTFEDKDTKEVRTLTVKEYFLKTYKKKIEYDQLNLLHCGPQDKEIYLPMEYLRIDKGQKVSKKLSPDELRKFIQSTAVSPQERFYRIQQIAKKNDLNNDPFLKALGATVAGAPLPVEGKVLPPVVLEMDNKFVAKLGVWDVREKRFYTAGEVDPWAVVNYGGRRTGDAIRNFVSMMMNMGKKLGMTIGEPHFGSNVPREPSIELEGLKRKIPGLKIVLVILGNSESLYAQVKVAGDVEIGMITQCVNSSNVSRCSPAIVRNILQQINAKVGGTNNIIGPDSRPVVFTSDVIFLGADVNHPPAGDRSTPSLAAVVGSMDRFASQYSVEVRSQECRKEVIVDLEEMTMSLLKKFFIRTRRQPERIIMYRDGVSESQFAEVLSYELQAMRRACTKLGVSYKPAITFIVVQKRHHTRLYCNERDGVGRNKNIPPGTTVDKSITHPFERDFFLCSHQGIRGTSKPSHYHVLWDDSDMNADQIQQMTYAMCHLYSRCTRSVSIPTPAYYAHLAAYRAKVHILELIQSDSGSLASGGEAGHFSNDEIMKAIRINQALQMYFL
ncbi:protein argonaute-2-like [Oratosquilla oratoria]|uniref:protein argonaute-2-like n=1 Tax=Oratosquilla oratoria TaxID=337810 RepID=UPI003F75C26B